MIEDISQDTPEDAPGYTIDSEFSTWLLNSAFIQDGGYGRLSEAFWLAINSHDSRIEQKIQGFIDFATQEPSLLFMNKAISERQSILRAFLDKDQERGWHLFNTLLGAKNQNIAVLFLKYFINHQIISCKNPYYEEFINALWDKAKEQGNSKVIAYLKTLHPTDILKQQIKPSIVFNPLVGEDIKPNNTRAHLAPHSNTSSTCAIQHKTGFAR